MAENVWELTTNETTYLYEVSPVVTTVLPNFPGYDDLPAASYPATIAALYERMVTVDELPEFSGTDPIAQDLAGQAIEKANAAQAGVTALGEAVGGIRAVPGGNTGYLKANPDGTYAFAAVEATTVGETAVSAVFEPSAAGLYQAALLVRQNDGKLGKFDPFRAMGRINVKAAGVKGDGVTDDAPLLQTLINLAQSAGTELFFPDGTYSLGAGLDGTTSARLIGQSWAAVLSLKSTVSDDVLKIGSGSAAFSGLVQNLTCEATGGAKAGKAGIALDAARFALVDHTQVRGVDIGYDLRANCYGAVIRDPRAVDTCNVGMLLRPGPQSGADITITNPWLAGRYASVVIERDGGGYHFVGGGQFAGGGSLGVETDLWGSLVLGLTYIPDTTLAASLTGGATTISVADASAMRTNDNLVISNADGTDILLVGYTGKSGNTLTGVTYPDSAYNSKTLAAGCAVRTVGSTVNQEFLGTSFEGTTKRAFIRSWWESRGNKFQSCNFNSNNPNRATHVLKASRALSSSFTFDQCSVQGTYTGTKAISASGTGSGFRIHEVFTHSPTTPSFAGVSISYQTRLMVEDAGIGSAASGVTRNYILSQGVQFVPAIGRGTYLGSSGSSVYTPTRSTAYADFIGGTDPTGTSANAVVNGDRWTDAAGVNRTRISGAWV